MFPFPFLKLYRTALKLRVSMMTNNLPSELTNESVPTNRLCYKFAPAACRFVRVRMCWNPNLLSSSLITWWSCASSKGPLQIALSIRRRRHHSREAPCKVSSSIVSSTNLLSSRERRFASPTAGRVAVCSCSRSSCIASPRGMGFTLSITSFDLSTTACEWTLISSSVFVSN